MFIAKLKEKLSSRRPRSGNKKTN